MRILKRRQKYWYRTNFYVQESSFFFETDLAKTTPTFLLTAIVFCPQTAIPDLNNMLIQALFLVNLGKIQ